MVLSSLLGVCVVRSLVVSEIGLGIIFVSMIEGGCVDVCCGSWGGAVTVSDLMTKR